MTKTGVDSLIAAIARFLLGGFFVLSAIENLMSLSITAEQIDIEGAVLLIILGALFKFTLGLSLAFRYHTKYASFGLAIYLAVVSVLFYGPQNWTDENLYSFIFTRNLAIIGGLLFVCAHSRGIGLWNEEWIPKKQKDQINVAQGKPLQKWIDQ